MKRLLALGLAFMAAVIMPTAKASPAADKKVRLAAATALWDSGLLPAILPVFTGETGFSVDVTSVGAGRALEMADRGEADVILVNAVDDEAVFVHARKGINRRPVLADYFIIAGPRHDPAGIGELNAIPEAISQKSVCAACGKGGGASSFAVEALRRIADKKQPFISRGDGSGTHIKEKNLWSAVKTAPSGPWYISSGRGMADAIRLADEKNAYVLCDEATFYALQDTVKLAALYARRDEILINTFAVITTSPAMHPAANSDGASSLTRWLLSPQGQKLIGAFSDVRGRAHFTPLAPDRD